MCIEQESSDSKTATDKNNNALTDYKPYKEFSNIIIYRYVYFERERGGGKSLWL